MGNFFFVTGIGTGIGKTVVSTFICEAIHAAYWKPIQAGTQEIDKKTVEKKNSLIFSESYVLKTPASPHLAARKEGIKIKLSKIMKDFETIKKKLPPHTPLIVEGAGGLLSPINDTEQNIHLIQALNIPVIIVSRNYLGSINHSLLTAQALQQAGCKVLGWVFNDTSMGYEKEIVKWTGIPILFNIPKLKEKGHSPQLKNKIVGVFKQYI